jgi:hypothetical protein
MIHGTNKPLSRDFPGKKPMLWGELIKTSASEEAA